MDANIDINVPLVAIDLNFPFFNYEANSPNSLDLNEPPLNEDDVPLFLSSDPTEEEYTQSDEEFEDFLNNQWDVEQENLIDGIYNFSFYFIFLAPISILLLLPSSRYLLLL